MRERGVMRERGGGGEGNERDGNGKLRRLESVKLVKLIKKYL